MTIPGKLQAYLMAGKPILAMLNGEGARIVTESGCGIACSSGDVHCLANAVRKLAHMSSFDRETMGERGHQYSAKEFDREMLISRLEKWMIELSEMDVQSRVER
jgi:glycosyltransferase involved in cell wall biosynthesis